MACAKVCPTQAAVGERKKVHTIIQDKCIQCGLCFQACRFDAIEVLTGPEAAAVGAAEPLPRKAVPRERPEDRAAEGRVEEGRRQEAGRPEQAGRPQGRAPAQSPRARASWRSS